MKFDSRRRNEKESIIRVGVKRRPWLQFPLVIPESPASSLAKTLLPSRHDPWLHDEGNSGYNGGLHPIARRKHIHPSSAMAPKTYNVAVIGYGMSAKVFHVRSGPLGFSYEADLELS